MGWQRDAQSFVQLILDLGVARGVEVVVVRSHRLLATTPLHVLNMHRKRHAAYGKVTVGTELACSARARPRVTPAR